MTSLNGIWGCRIVLTPNKKVAAVFTIGHVVEIQDYHKMGEDYKNYVDRHLQNGLFHNDQYF